MGDVGIYYIFYVVFFTELKFNNLKLE